MSNEPALTERLTLSDGGVVTVSLERVLVARGYSRGRKWRMLGSKNMYILKGPSGFLMMLRIEATCNCVHEEQTGDLTNAERVQRKPLLNGSRESLACDLG